MPAASSSPTAGRGALGRPFLFGLGRLLSLDGRRSAAGLKKAHFTQPWFAAGLLAPQLLILLFFFFIPSYKALSLAFVQIDPFGGRVLFVGFDNFRSCSAAPVPLSAFLIFTGGQHQLLIAGLRLRHRFRDRGAASTNVISMPYAIAR